MQTNIHFPATPIALKIAVAIGIGMLVGLEREWSNKDVGIRTFAIVALSGMLAAIINPALMVTALIGTLLLVAAVNARSIATDRSLEITTSAALIATYLLGALVGLGHVFTPVAGAIVMTMLLAWKTELSRFAGGLQPAEIRSAVLLGLIGLVIYPVLPKQAIDPWGLLNPSDAWISVIAIAGIGFTNYVLLRLYSTSGLYLGAVFGGLVNSTATVAELSSRLKEKESLSKLTSLCLVTTMAMFARNLVLAALFSPATLSATLVPLLAMTLVAGLWVWREERVGSHLPSAPLTLTSPIALGKVLRFGAVFVVVQIAGAVLTRAIGNPGLFIVALIGGLVSSASTTAAAATMAMHGQISPAAAGSATVLASVASVFVNVPIVSKMTRNTDVIRRLALELGTVIAAGVVAVVIDRVFQFSEMVRR